MNIRDENRVLHDAIMRHFVYHVKLPTPESLPPRNQPIHRVIPENPDEGSDHNAQKLMPAAGEEEGGDAVIRESADCAGGIECEEAEENGETPQARMREGPEIIEGEIEKDSRLDCDEDGERKAKK